MASLYDYNTSVGILSLVAHFALAVAIYMSVTFFYLEAVYSPTVIYFQYYPLGICIGLYVLYMSYPEKSIGACMLIMTLVSMVSIILFMVQLNMSQDPENLFTGQYYYPIWNTTHQVTVNVSNNQETVNYTYYTWNLVMSFLTLVISLLHFGFSFYMIKIDEIDNKVKYNMDTHPGTAWVPVNFLNFRNSKTRFYNPVRVAITVLSIMCSILCVIYAVCTYLFLAVGVVTFSPFSNFLFVLVPFFIISIKPPPPSKPSPDQETERKIFNMVVYDQMSIDNKSSNEKTHPAHDVEIKNENILWYFGQVSYCNMIYILFFILALAWNWVVFIQNSTWRTYNEIDAICINSTAEAAFANSVTPRTFLFFGNQDTTPVQTPVQELTYRSSQPDVVAQFSCANDWMNLIILFIATVMLFLVFVLYGYKPVTDTDLKTLKALLKENKHEEIQKLINIKAHAKSKQTISTDLRIKYYFPKTTETDTS